MKFEEYRQHDALGLAALVAKGEVSAAELLETAIARAEAVNPKINAIVHPMHELARARASVPPGAGAFAGVPFLIKDLVAEYAGVPTRSGSRLFADYVPTEDSELVRRYKAAGLVIFGKTNTPEFGLTPFTEPVLFGPSRNPWDVTRTTGGSSGGTGAAIAVGIVPMASGGDGGGSIRIPASCCGLVGLKPTRGRIPTGPQRGDVWFGFATEHVLSRSVRDSAAALDVTGAPEAGAYCITPPPAQTFLQQITQSPRRLRVAYTAKPLTGLLHDPECAAGVANAVKLLQSLGHEVVEAAPSISREAFIVAFVRLIASEVASDVAAGARVMGRAVDESLLETNTRAVRRIGRAMTGEQVAAALREMATMTRSVGRFFNDYDVLLTPTLGRPPFVIGELQPRGLDGLKAQLAAHLPIGALANSERELLAFARNIFDWIPNTAVFNVTGQPSISLPLHWSAEGLPVGMMLTGRFADDGLLLQLAAQLEQAQPWFNRVPSL